MPKSRRKVPRAGGNSGQLGSLRGCQLPRMGGCPVPLGQARNKAGRRMPCEALRARHEGRRMAHGPAAPGSEGHPKCSLVSARETEALRHRKFDTGTGRLRPPRARLAPPLFPKMRHLHPLDAVRVRRRMICRRGAAQVRPAQGVGLAGKARGVQTFKRSAFPQTPTAGHSARSMHTDAGWAALGATSPPPPRARSSPAPSALGAPAAHRLQPASARPPRAAAAHSVPPLRLPPQHQWEPPALPWGADLRPRARSAPVSRHLFFFYSCRRVRHCQAAEIAKSRDDTPPRSAALPENPSAGERHFLKNRRF